MTDLPTDDIRAQGEAIFARAKAILLKPIEEWPRIAAEATPPTQVFLRYAVPLAAIGPIASFLHGQLFGYGAFGFSWHPGLVSSLAALVSSYVMALVGLFVLTVIADLLAPKFDGTSDRAAATRLVVYGATASFVAGAFSLIPGLGILGLLGLYSFYLFYTGAAPLMKVPADKALSFTAVTVVCGIVLSIVAGAVVAPVLRLTGGDYASHDESGGKVTLPGGGTLDLDQARKAGEQMKAAADGKKVAVDPAKLQDLLPASAGGWQRTSVESAAAGPMGSEATGTYSSGGKSFHLKVSDMAGLGALAGLGSAFGVQQSREDADGYEKTGTVDGHLQTEAWHKSSSSGKFSTIIANRFMIEAEGDAGSIDDLKAAVAQIDQGKLESLAN